MISVAEDAKAIFQVISFDLVTSLDTKEPLPDMLGSEALSVFLVPDLKDRPKLPTAQLSHLAISPPVFLYIS